MLDFSENATVAITVQSSVGVDLLLQLESDTGAVTPTNADFTTTTCTGFARAI